MLGVVFARYSRPALLLLALFTAAGCHIHRPTTPIGQPGVAHASYAIGWKGRDSSWDGAEDEFIFGVIDFDVNVRRSPFWFTSKILFGTADEPDYVGDPDADSSGTAEFDFGVRTYTILGPVEPFASGGLAVLYGSITGDDGDHYYSKTLDEEVTLGGWVDAGFHLPITPYWGVGMIVHYSHGPEKSLEGEDVQLGGLSILFTIGGRW